MVLTATSVQGKQQETPRTRCYYKVSRVLQILDSSVQEILLLAALLTTEDDLNDGSASVPFQCGSNDETVLSADVDKEVEKLQPWHQEKTS